MVKEEINICKGISLIRDKDYFSKDDDIIFDELVNFLKGYSNILSPSNTKYNNMNNLVINAWRLLLKSKKLYTVSKILNELNISTGGSNIKKATKLLEDSKKFKIVTKGKRKMFCTKGLIVKGTVKGVIKNPRKKVSSEDSRVKRMKFINSRINYLCKTYQWNYPKARQFAINEWNKKKINKVNESNSFVKKSVEFPEFLGISKEIVENLISRLIKGSIPYIDFKITKELVGWENDLLYNLFVKTFMENSNIISEYIGIENRFKLFYNTIHYT